MDLSIYEIIRNPRVTNKALQLNQQLKKLVLHVHPKANKSMVAEAIERLFDVKVKKVNIVVRKGKVRRTRRGREETQGPTMKKAIITLAPGYALDLFDQAGKVAVVEKNKE